MRVQNNVNYNSNPGFGTKLSLKGPISTVRKFADALEGGFIAQGRSNSIAVEFVSADSAPFYVALDKDTMLLRSELEKHQHLESTGGTPTIAMDSYKGVLKKVFGTEDTDEIVLEEGKPLTLCFKFAKETRQNAINLVKALAGGFTAQEQTLMSGTALMNIHVFGDEIYLTKGFVQRLADNAQVIHVTE